MLTVQDCRKYLDSDTNESMSDSEIVAVRDEMYKLAGLIPFSNQHLGNTPAL